MHIKDFILFKRYVHLRVYDVSRSRSSALRIAFKDPESDVISGVDPAGDEVHPEGGEIIAIKVRQEATAEGRTVQGCLRNSPVRRMYSVCSRTLITKAA